MRRRFARSALAFLLLVFLSQALPEAAFAQSGKLAGTVTEAGTGDPIPGATVVLANTSLGTATDAQGRYTIIGITPGTYDVRVSFVGFGTQVIENVLITPDRTKTLDVTLSEEVVQGSEIVVEAGRAVVDVNQTTSRSLVTSEEISRLPVTSLEDVISRTSNSYKGFVRGSRRFETKTIIEGIDISDAFYSLSQGAGPNQQESTNYGTANRVGETSASLLTINPAGVEQVSVNTGATGAQYAAGTGGVVAVTLAEGRGPLRGSISARVAPSLSQPGPDSLSFYRDADDYFADLQLEQSAADPNQEKIALYTFTEDKYAVADDPEFDIRASLGGSITDKWTFNAAGQFFQTNGYLPNYFRRRINGQLKTSYQIAEKTRVTAVGIIDDQGRWGDWNNRDYTELFRFYLEGVAQHDQGTYVGSVKLTQVLSDKSFLDVQFYRTFNQIRYGYPDDDGDGFTELGEDGDFIDFRDPDVVAQYIGINGITRDEVNNPRMFIDIVTDPFSESGVRLPNGRRYRLARPSPFAEDRLNAANAVKVDYANQITFNHFLQAGIEFKQRQIEFHSVNGSTGSGVYLNDEVEPFRVNDYERKPWELALYASDRMEYGGLIVNLGLRMEVVDRDAQEINDYFYPFRLDSVQVAGNTLFRHFFDRGDDVPTDVLWNPSVGVSHPIGTSASMYFSYARSQQLLPYSELYLNYDGNHSNNRFISYSNPAQDPVTSNSFELGVQWEFVEGWGADINAYARSIDNYGRVNFVANNRTPEGAPALAGLTQHTFRTNFGYAESRGVELVLRRRPLELANDVTLGVTASYTFSTVEEGRVTGQNSTTFAFDEESGDTSLPFDNANDFQNFPQNVQGGSVITGGYDRRHRGILRAVAGLPYDISLGLLSTLESGFLYPNAIGADPRDRELETAPANFQVDLRLEKRFMLTNRFGADFYVDVTNLFDRDNVIAYDTDAVGADVVFQETGVPGSRLILTDGSPLYGPSRTIYFGSRIRF